MKTLDALVSCGLYEGALEESIKALKYEFREELAQHLAREVSVLKFDPYQTRSGERDVLDAGHLVLGSDALDLLRDQVDALGDHPRRGVGDTSIAKIESYANGAGVTFREAIRDAAAAGVTGRALGGCKELLDLVEEVEHAAAGGVGAALQTAVKRSG